MPCRHRCSCPDCRCPCTRPPSHARGSCTSSLFHKQGSPPTPPSHARKSVCPTLSCTWVGILACISKSAMPPLYATHMATARISASCEGSPGLRGPAAATCTAPSDATHIHTHTDAAGTASSDERIGVLSSKSLRKCPLCFASVESAIAIFEP